MKHLDGHNTDAEMCTLAKKLLRTFSPVTKKESFTNTVSDGNSMAA